MSVSQATYLAAIITFIGALMVTGRPSKPSYAELQEELDRTRTELLMKQSEELGTLRGMNYR